MAQRRMISKTIVESDAFLDMPASARLLYYDLNIRADDDGFVNSPKKVMRETGASNDDLMILIGKKFIIPFESGVVVIKHWRIHNYIRSDRYKETNYKEEKALLMFDENGAYSQNPKFEQCLPCVIPNDNQPSDERDTQVRLGKVRKDIYGTFKNVKLSEEEYKKLNSEYGETKAINMIEYLSTYREEKGYKNKSDYLSLRRWVSDAVDKRPNKPESQYQEI